jgi:hypothetical protein
MFKKKLESQLKQIFEMPVKFQAPVYGDEAMEQDTIFVEVQKCRPRVQGLRILDKVEGHLVVFSRDDQFTFGLFSKAVERSTAEARKGLSFFEMDTVLPESPARVQNLQETRSKFLYLFEDQYDPDKGELTSVEF